MVERSLKFVEEYGPIILEGFTFEGGYTDIVQAGDGDFITEDTLWDFKVTSASITTRHLAVAYVLEDGASLCTSGV
jgi:hypothetical protein